MKRERRNVNEKIQSISKLAAPVMNKYQFDKYGDYLFHHYSNKKGEFHGYTYSYIRTGLEYELLGSLTERTGYTIFEHYASKNYLIIRKECKNLTIDSPYIAFDLIYTRGNEDEVFDRYFECMGINPPTSKPCVGWTSWYHYYHNINQNIILENLDNFKHNNRAIDIFQIDDGYQTAVGDWLSVDAGKFSNGMKYIVDHIKENGYEAGLWLAPFVCETNSKIFREKQEWILKDDDGNLVLAGSNWSRFYALDFYHPQVQEYVKRVFQVILEDWGYDLVKLDFLYAVCLLPRKDKTRGQIMTEAMEFLRECVGTKKILGCGVPLGPSFGLVDYCRIGCDISLDWNDKFYMRKLHRERISTLHAIENTIGRRQLNKRAFLNDPDVFLLRKDNIKLNENQRDTLAVVNNLFGSVLFTSDNLKLYTEEQFSVFDRTVALKNRKIKRVEQYRNGLVEILYQEEGDLFLLLLNLSGKIISYVRTELGVKRSLVPYSNYTCKLK